jgi:ABC-type uncharacterized transport system ATPase subunit
MTLADRVLVLYRGSIVLEAQGIADDLERVGQAMAGLAS